MFAWEGFSWDEGVSSFISLVYRLMNWFPSPKETKSREGASVSTKAMSGKEDEQTEERDEGQDA